MQSQVICDSQSLRFGSLNPCERRGKALKKAIPLKHSNKKSKKEDQVFIGNVPSATTTTESLLWWIIRCYIQSLFSTSQYRSATTPGNLDVTSDVVLSCCCCPSAGADFRQNQESPRQTKPKKGPKRKVHMNFAPIFLSEFWGVFP